MKYAVLIAALIAVPLFADDASRRAKAGELLDLMNGRQMQEQLFNSIKQMTLSQIPKESSSEMTTKLMDLLQSRMGWDSMRPEYESMYAQTFTEEELDGLVQFYRSPSGKAMLAKMPELMQKSMMFAQKRVAEMRPEIERIVKEAADKNKAK